MTDISSEQVEALATAIRSGSDLETSCHFAGISIAVCYRWLERGKLESERIDNGDGPIEDEAKYLDFWNSLKKARADAIIRNVANIQKAAQDGNWQASAWWLERTVPETYGKQRPTPSIGEGPKQLEN